MESKKIIKYIMADVKIPIAIFEDKTHQYLKNRCITELIDCHDLPEIQIHEKDILQEKIESIFSEKENQEKNQQKTEEFEDENAKTNDPEESKNEQSKKTESKAITVLLPEIQQYKKTPSQNQSFKKNPSVESISKKQKYSLKRRPNPLNVKNAVSDWVPEQAEKVI